MLTWNPFVAEHFPIETHKILFLVRNIDASGMDGGSCSGFADPATEFLRFDRYLFDVNGI